MKKKTYQFNYSVNGGDFYVIPDSNNKAYMAGFIIPISALAPADVLITHTIIDESPVTYSLDDLTSPTVHILPPNNSTPSGVYEFDSAIETVRNNILSDISMFWTNDITIPGTHITNLPCLVVCHQKTSKIEIEWEDETPTPIFNVSPTLVGYCYKYINEYHNLRLEINQIAITNG